ncbi:MAG: DUF192 domain-containing protein [Candidatus Puniceispirillaceae bacterium]
MAISSLPDRRRTLGALAGILCVCLASVLPGGAGVAADRPDFARSAIMLDRGDGAMLSFDVELAVTPRQHAHGLMHVASLPRAAGMLFIFKGDRQRSFWMKNTLIPLDILFFDGEGRFVSAAENAVPHSRESRLSDGPARYVLEINGGLMRELGIGRAARLILPLPSAP